MLLVTTSVCSEMKFKGTQRCSTEGGQTVKGTRPKCNYETNEFWVAYMNSTFPNCRQPAHRYYIVNILFGCSEFIIQQNSV